MRKFRVWEVTLFRRRREVFVWAYPNTWLLCAYAFLAYHLHAIWHQTNKAPETYLLGALIWCVVAAMHRHWLYKPILESQDEWNHQLGKGGRPE